MSGQFLLDADRLRVLKKVDAKCRELHFECFLIGGFVRDLFLQCQMGDCDIDLVVLGSAKELAVALSEEIGGVTRVFGDFLTAKVSGFLGYGACDEIDFATARTERYEHSGSLPQVKAASLLQEDLRRRDFTVNAIAIPLSGFLEAIDTCDIDGLMANAIDPFSGKGDLSSACLRVLHERSFIDDPTRILRLVRYQSRFGFAIEEETERALQEAQVDKVLENITVERLWNEIQKCLEERNLKETVTRLAQRGVFQAHAEDFSFFRNLSSATISLFGEHAEAFSIENRMELFTLIMLESAVYGGIGGRRNGQYQFGVDQEALGKLGIGKKKVRRLAGLRAGLVGNTIPDIISSYTKSVA